MKIQSGRLGFVQKLTGSDRHRPCFMRVSWFTGFVALSGIVFIASFLPWALFPPLDADPVAPATLPFLQPNLAVGIFTNSAPALTAWQGSFTVAGYVLPNWIVVLGALCLPFCVNRPKVGIAVTLFPLFHLMVFGLAIYLSPARWGVGYLITVATYVAFIWLLSVRINLRRRAAPPA